jgi:predicted HAD superfamily phosphohydrolase YqeG
MRPAYAPVAGLREAVRLAWRLSARTVIFDVEPLVAHWDSGQEALDRGIAMVLGEVAPVPGVQVVCFATNSLRRPAGVPSHAGVRVVYLAGARKPLWTAPYASFPRPGVVIGDQVATDGLLARRLGYAFLHYWPPGFRPPWGPRLLNYGGRAVRPFVFGAKR